MKLTDLFMLKVFPTYFFILFLKDFNLHNIFNIAKLIDLRLQLSKWFKVNQIPKIMYFQ